MHDALLAAAEEPGLVTPPAPGTTIVPGEGFTLVARTGRTTVERVRLEPQAVGPAVIGARAVARRLGARDLTWWAGELSRPAARADALLAEGLVPCADDPLSERWTEPVAVRL